MGLLGFLSKFGKQTAGTAAGVGLSMATAKVFEPTLDAAEQEVRERFGRTLLSPSEVAAADVRGVSVPGGSVQEARWGGVSSDRLSVLRELATARPALGEVLTMVNRGFLSVGEAAETLKLQGFRDDAIPALLNLRFQPPPSTQLADLVNRGEMSEGEATAKLTDAGLSPEDARSVIGLREVFPGPQDVVRFAVREVYTPALRQALGYDEEFPGPAVPDAARVGVSEEELRKYWAAHWQLPSVTQGFEMFHRGVIDRPTLEALLKALDIPAVWRDRLLQISFNPITRVDVRRMAQIGILGEEDVYRRYRDVGYSDEDARALTEWTFALQTEGERELTKAEVLGLYDARALKKDETSGLLKQLGYADSAVTLMVGLVESKRARRAQSLTASTVRSQFTRWKLSERDAVTQLDRLGVAPEERDELITVWKIEREIREPSLSTAVLQRLLRKGILGPDRFAEELQRQGWASEEVEWLLLDALPAATLAAALGEGEE